MSGTHQFSFLPNLDENWMENWGIFSYFNTMTVHLQKLKDRYFSFGRGGKIKKYIWRNTKSTSPSHVLMQQVHDINRRGHPSAPFFARSSSYTLYEDRSNSKASLQSVSHIKFLHPLSQAKINPCLINIIIKHKLKI